MSVTQTSYGQPFPRRQAQLLLELLSRPESPLRAVITGPRREGKSDLLRQVQALLFQKAEGPLPFRYSFETRKEAALALHFVATFCQQMRAFVMRQEEQLGEPLARIENELERPGLPLALTELGREFLSLPLNEQGEFAAALPAKFAHRDGRPLCLLFDDAEQLDPSLPILEYLDDPRLSWLITGRVAAVKRLAADRNWPVLDLEPFSLDEALSLAEERCREFEMRFSRQSWESWIELEGGSPASIHGLVEAAVASGRTIDSTEALGQVYVRELGAGSIGNWMAGRWKRATQRAPSTAQGAPPVADRAALSRVGEYLLNLNAPDSPTHSTTAATISNAMWDGLVAEEWAEETAIGYRSRLGMIERDWLQQALNPEGAGSERAQAAALQGFLLRAERARQWREFSAGLSDLRHNLLHLPQSGSAGSSSRGAKDFRLPLVCSIAMERTATAELYWCYGFRPDWPQERRDRPEAACVYLIALCREQPGAAEVKQWSRRLQEEARSLPAVGGPLAGREEKAASSGQGGLGPRYELWLSLPRGASLAAVAGERRLRWEGLAKLLEEKGSPAAATMPPMLHLEKGESQLRLNELEARAQWLEEELATAREQFRKEVKQIPPREAAASETGSPADMAADRGTGGEPADFQAKMALSLSLLQVSAELLALQSASDPATLDSIREIQLKTQKLAELLRRQDPNLSPEGLSRNPDDPSPASDR